MFPIQYARRCFFVKRASRSKEKNFTSLEIEVRLSDPKGKSVIFGSISREITEPAKAKEWRKSANTFAEPKTKQ